MATTAKGIVPQAKATTKKPLTKKHKTKLLTGLEQWRASLTAEDREALNERNRQTHQERWTNMSERERKDRLAGVRAWQKAQKAAKRAAAKAVKPGATTGREQAGLDPIPEPKANPKKAPRKAAKRTEVSEGAVEIEVIGPNGTSKPPKGNNVLAAPKRTRKAVAK